MDWLKQDGRARLLAALVLAVTFLAGALAGAAVLRVADAESVPSRGYAHHGGSGRSPFAPGSPLSERLQLTPAQRTQVDAILAAEKPRADSLFHAMGESIRAVIHDTHARVRAVLTPAQRKEYDRFMAERRQMIRRERGDSPRQDGRPQGR